LFVKKLKYTVMKTNVKKQNLQPLNSEELAMVNGGASTNSASMTMSSSADSLVSMEFNWQQGDNYRDYKISAGNGIHADLNAFANGSSIK
jgi:hypothetical protein